MTSWPLRALSASVILALVMIGSLNAEAPAWAIDYPTWDDVAAARTSEASTKAKMAEIATLIAGLQSEVERTEAESIAAGNAYQTADQAFQEQALRTTELESQVEAATLVADESIARAGELIAEMYRSGNGDVATTLLVDPDAADDLLYTLGMSDKLTQKTAAVYETALQAQRSAQSLTDQATVATSVREELRAEAEAALQAAALASDAAAVALEEQQQHQAQLDAQLSVLTERREATEADYLAGERAAAAAAAAAAASGRLGLRRDSDGQLRGSGRLSGGGSGRGRRGRRHEGSS